MKTTKKRRRAVAAKSKARVSTAGSKPLAPGLLAKLRAPLTRANGRLSRLRPGESSERQPVHVVYGGAHLFKADTAWKLGELATKSLRSYAPDGATLAQALGHLGGEFAQTLYLRVWMKLEREPVEDYRIDFEDGYGHRPDEEEDRHAVAAAEELARGHREKTLPPFVGIRVKAFTEPLFARSTRTLDLFLRTLLANTGGELPANFVVTLPKVQLPEQVTAMCRVLELIEKRGGLRDGAVKLELMVETPESLVSPDGSMALPGIVAAAEGRCVAVHFGAYDYTAACGITAAQQTLDHPACDFARQLMQVSLAGTGVRLSDGATTLMPVGPHKGEALTPPQQAENRNVVLRAWRAHEANIRRALAAGFYQGWDLHPAQLPVRYAATYAFFLEGLASASLRLRHFMDRAAQASRVGDVFDDAATGQGLLNFFLRGLACGALTEAEALSAGLTVEELRLGDFAAILESRRPKAGV